MQGGPGWPGSSSRQRADEAVLVGACCTARDARPAAPAQSLGSLRSCPALGCLFPSLAHLSELRFGRVPSLGLVLQVGHVGLARGTEQPHVPVLRCPSPRRSQPQTPAALLRPFVLPGLELARGSGPSCWVLGCDSPSCSRFPPSFKDAHSALPCRASFPAPLEVPAQWHGGFAPLLPLPGRQPGQTNLRAAAPRSRKPGSCLAWWLLQISPEHGCSSGLPFPLPTSAAGRGRLPAAMGTGSKRGWLQESMWRKLEVFAQNLLQLLPSLLSESSKSRMLDAGSGEAAL